MFLLPFHIIGYTHESNPAEQVGCIRLSAERIDAALGELHRREIAAVMLSTCHRTELYWWGDAELDEWFGNRVLEGRADKLRLDRADADLAVRHLFAVAAGMKSARFGEPEILGQLRRTWGAARAIGTSHGELDSAFRHAIDAARHIRSAMGSDADPSLGERVRAQLIAHAESRFDGTASAPMRVLVIGSGEAARGVLEALRRQPLPMAALALTSRTDARAAALASTFGVRMVPWSERESAMTEADAVVFAVHVTSPLVGAETAMAAQSRNGRALWIDLGVPGAVATGFTSPSVQLVSLAHIEAPSPANAEQLPSFHDARLRRATLSLQQELARYARATHRHQLGARLGTLEAEAVAVAAGHGDVPVADVVRRVTRLVLRELTRA